MKHSHLLILAAIAAAIGLGPVVFSWPPAETPNEITNSIGMKLVLIPKGTFTMGSAAAEEGADGDEQQHEVTISQTYYLGTTEVTQGQFERVMDYNPSWFLTRVMLKDSSMHPVEKVSWEEAVQFCKRLSALPAERAAGRVYRLPTEAEWEHACRAGTETAFSFGDDADALGDHAWWGINSEESTHPVGEKKPNAWGLYDMHGNVWEWCSDWYGDYPQEAVTDPKGAPGGFGRVYRGGGWGFSARLCRSACRENAFEPSYANFSLGFRVAMSSAGR